MSKKRRTVAAIQLGPPQDAAGAPKNPFEHVRLGDRVRVSWPKHLQVGIPESACGREGVVVQVSPKFLVVKSRSGYTFCVGAHHVLEGAEIRILESRG